MTKRAERYAEHYGLRTKSVEKVSNAIPPVYHAQGFSHPDIPVVLPQEESLSLFHWGLIPFWVKDSKSATQLSNKTLNARGEEMFEKPAFRQSARTRRCLVVTDGFFEHYWEKGNSYPFYITHQDDEPITLAGLWDKWENHEGDVTYSVSIVTTAANELMKKIHNNPRASEGPRMPLVLTPELYRSWLEAPDDPAGKQQILEIVNACDPDFLRSWPVGRLRGRQYQGNVPAIRERVTYEEMHDPTH
jgi:putative SOS response-associated peptidase YedK